jgi:hypothetical protein
MSYTVEERIEIFAETLNKRFKYKKKEAKVLATEAMQNLDRHVKLQEAMIKRLIEGRKK